ncbi:unnamed protein product [Diabrotica balteata]|uniref:Uncharacterized protein n=1 Tax=Diabrotica balteata TaxID=107213 RepID=A0A9N9SVD9_DIABA|nr:unnamed protein product [Diabrotica balteata]
MHKDSSVIDHQKKSSTSTSKVILSTESISNVSRLQSELRSTSGTAKMFSDASNKNSESERDHFKNSSESYVPSDSELSSDDDQIMEEPLKQHREELAQQKNKTKKRKQALDFFIPKKDHCFKCNAYNTAKEKEPLKEEFDSHKKRENDAMQMKSEDKERAAREKGQTFRAATFDL